MKSTAETRTRVARNYALIAPDGWVNSALPGWTNCQIHVIINPAMGAGFTQQLIFMGEDAQGSATATDMETFIYAMEGSGDLELTQGSQTIGSGDFAFVPAGSDFKINSPQGLKITLFQKHYHPLEGHPTPDHYLGNIEEVKSEIYLEDTQLHMQTLLPDDISFDMAVNVFTYDPGGNLPFVETHVMEHGLIYLSGQGIYRLDNAWFPVMKDDCIWMAPYCPQWFVAMGKEPAVYLYYKNVNRHPL